MTIRGHRVSRRQLLKSATAAGLFLTARAAFAADPIRIGFGMSLTGPNAGAGKMFLVGREIWRDEVNAKGGLLGRPVEVVYYDDQRNPSAVPGLYSQLPDADSVARVRANAEEAGLKIVYDRSFPPSTVDHTPIVRGIQASEPDIVFVASYATGSVGMVRVVTELGYKPRMFGGAMIGLQFTPIKVQLGPLLNGVVINENYVPEKTMNFPGVDDVLKRYQQRAAAAGTDPLGFWSPFSYAEMQILGQAVSAVGSLDQGKLADHLHKTPFKTVIGDVKFGPLGEWEKSRILYIQYQHIQGNDINQFRQPGKELVDVVALD